MGSGQGLLLAAEASTRGVPCTGPSPIHMWWRLSFLSKVKKTLPFSSELILATRNMPDIMHKHLSLRTAAQKHRDCGKQAPDLWPVCLWRWGCRPLSSELPWKRQRFPSPLSRRAGGESVETRAMGAQTERDVPSSFSPSMASWSPLRPLLVTEENCQLSTSESCAQRAQGGFRKKDRFWGEDTV